MQSEASAPTRLDQLFAAQVAATPEAPAVRFDGQDLSYSDLMSAVASMSRALVDVGVTSGVLVAIGLERSPALLAMVLAVLDAGGAYLPLDRRYPPERMRFVLADSRAPVLVVDGGWQVPSDYEGTILELVEGSLIQRTYQSAGAKDAPSDLAYVIYTSGSTGAPKGVMLGHSAVCLVEWARQVYSPAERSCVAATTSLCFDPSVFEMFVPLCTGGTVLLKADALAPFGPGERPTMLDTTPSVLTELCRGGSIPDSVRILNVGGEPLHASLVSEVYERYPDLRLHNHYGPTEATTCATVAEIPRGLSARPSLGRPVAGAQIVLMTPDGQAVDEEQVGEIHIGGTGLALGYLNRPELTADRFVGDGAERLYRTGDFGFWLSGNLHFAGRADQQVKVRGFRVELGEVEAAMRQIATVDACVAGMRDVAGSAHLVGWVQTQTPPEEVEFRAALAEWLPDYMVPSRIVSLRTLPRLVSGKIDYDALPPPSDRRASGEGGPASVGEKAITHVFEELLGRTLVAPEESFFDLGGDSLMSVRAALRLQQVLGCEVPAALIHQAPSARLLARALDQQLFRAQSHVSLLSGGAGERTLFCIADLFGHAFNYLSLARRLSLYGPVYGLAPGPLQDDFTRDRDLDRLVHAFVAEIRRLSPQGPYVILGYSAGGVIAGAVAAQLQVDGAAVRLVLLDAYLHSRRPSLRWMLRWSARQFQRLSCRPTILDRGRRTIGFLGRLLLIMARKAPRPPTWVPLSQVAYASSLIKVGLAYTPAPFAGPALIASVAEPDPTDDLFGEDDRLGWSKVLCGDVTRAQLQGDHHSFMREPGVEEAALLIDRFLENPGGR